MVSSSQYSRHLDILTSVWCSPVTRLVPVGLGPPRDQTDRDLPRTNGVCVALAYGAYATVYRSECPQGIRAGDGASPMFDDTSQDVQSEEMFYRWKMCDHLVNSQVLRDIFLRDVGLPLRTWPILAILPSQVEFSIDFMNGRLWKCYWAVCVFLNVLLFALLPYRVVILSANSHNESVRDVTLPC